MLIVILGCCGSSTDARSVEKYDRTECHNRLWSDELNGYHRSSKSVCSHNSVCSGYLRISEIYGMLEAYLSKM
jgi:hypothetical protein